MISNPYMSEPNLYWYWTKEYELYPGRHRLKYYDLNLLYVNIFIILITPFTKFIMNPFPHPQYKRCSIQNATLTTILFVSSGDNNGVVTQRSTFLFFICLGELREQLCSRCPPPFLEDTQILPVSWNFVTIFGAFLSGKAFLNASQQTSDFDAKFIFKNGHKFYSWTLGVCAWTAFVKVA